MGNDYDLYDKLFQKFVKEWLEKNKDKIENVDDYLKRMENELRKRSKTI